MLLRQVHILSLSCTPFKCHAPPLSQVLMSLSTHFYASTCSKILIVQVRHLEGPNLSMDNWVLYSFQGLTSEIPFIFAKKSRDLKIMEVIIQSIDLEGR